MVTVVQAKKYSSRPINLDTVAALFGNAVAQKATAGMLATTSRFQPAAKRFAKTVSSDINFPKIDLVDSKRVCGWCADIAIELDRYFNNGEVAAPPIITPKHIQGLSGRIVVATGGYDMIIVYFARIVADFPYEVVLETVASEETSGDGQRGTVTAKTDSPPGLDLPHSRSQITTLYIFGAAVICIRYGTEARKTSTTFIDCRPGESVGRGNEPVTRPAECY